MNRRTLKKKCKRAMAVLIEKHGYRPDQFLPADGWEAIDAPKSMEGRFVRRGFLEPGPLKGTPLLWCQVSYECDEWDADLPTRVLADIEFWESMSTEELNAWAA